MSSSSSPIITVIVDKTSSQQSGLFLYQDEKGRIIINQILENSIFANSRLKSSMEILSVNGMNCSSNAMTDSFLISFIDEIDGKVTITARDVVFDAVVVVDEENPQPIIPSAPPSSSVPLSSPPAINPAYVGATSTTTNNNATTISTTTGNNNNNNNNHSSGRRPPPGCREGGRWAVIKGAGEKTVMMCLFLAILCGIFSLCGACAFLCPIDEKDVYVVDGNVYDKSGTYLGKVSTFQFV